LSHLVISADTGVSIFRVGGVGCGCGKLRNLHGVTAQKTVA